MSWCKAERESVKIAFSNKLVVTSGEKEEGRDTDNIRKGIKTYYYVENK